MGLHIGDFVGVDERPSSQSRRRTVSSFLSARVCLAAFAGGATCRPALAVGCLESGVQHIELRVATAVGRLVLQLGKSLLDLLRVLVFEAYDFVFGFPSAR